MFFDEEQLNILNMKNLCHKIHKRFFPPDPNQITQRTK